MLNLDSLKKSRVYEEGIEEGVLKNKLEMNSNLTRVRVNH